MRPDERVKEKVLTGECSTCPNMPYCKIAKSQRFGGCELLPLFVKSAEKEKARK